VKRSLVSLVAIAALAAGCGGGGSGGSPSGSPSATSSPRPSSPAKLTIVSPTNGEVFQSSSIPVRIRLQGARIVRPVTTRITPTKGHIHLLVDNKIVSMNYQLVDVLHGVKPGTHVLQVEFVAADHLPFDPRVIQAVTFEVKS
jgi:hypothetical protein